MLDVDLLLSSTLGEFNSKGNPKDGYELLHPLH
jgi:hypothetical protein